MAAPYGNDGTSLTLEVEGTGVTLSQSEFTMTNKEWTAYEVTLTGTGTIRLKFTPAKRFFLDEVLVVATGSGEVGINTAQVRHGEMMKNQYYTLDGRCINGTPTQRGIYIFNGKKVIVK